MTTGKTIALTIRTLVGKAMSLIMNMLSRLVITFLPRSKCLLISSKTNRGSWVNSNAPGSVCHGWHRNIWLLSFGICRASQVAQWLKKKKKKKTYLPMQEMQVWSPGQDSLLYSCLGNPIDRGVWLSTVDGIAKSWTQLGMHSGQKSSIW